MHMNGLTNTETKHDDLRHAMPSLWRRVRAFVRGYSSGRLANVSHLPIHRLNACTWPMS
jgi:hypothetical protein